MPNWVHSGFEVKGATAEVARFKSMMFRPITDADRTFDPHRRGIVLDFNGIIPMPPEEALSNYVGWASLNWGVDRNADNLTIHSDEEDGICFQFDTPWEFPTPVFEALAREFPALVFSGSAFEDSDGNEWKGEFNGANDWGPGEIEWVVNTGLTSKDLSRYRLPEFWRDASIVLAVLPAAWVASRGLHCSMLLHEALCGVQSPADADVPASETPFHEDIDIRTATLCWEHATLHRTVFVDHVVRVIDPTPMPLIEAPLSNLLAHFGSASALRKAALAFVDRMLAESDPAPEYLRTFFDERMALAVEIAAKWENPGHA
ncbi:hypothetical protein [Sphingomonas sp. NFX23]|uniref:hypothetical protein n=1 Tax=Sphingomonas sp. NFX23 TaxID=2819532 RepID=UPI003CEDF1D4